jgi:formate hydrogenlyase subunit 6/NADH:ubiquinone oxidoreductase subunit I
MIVNLKKKNIFNELQNFFIFLKGILNISSNHSVSRRLYDDSLNLKKDFYTKYPLLKKDQVDNPICVSCGVCEDICPTSAIKIEKANLINFPKSLMTGEAPLHFYVKVDDCLKCGLCRDVCLTDAIEMKGDFAINKVDLVQI